MNPLEQLRADREHARELADANRDVCFLALAEDNQPSVRTLVLRDITDTAVTLFISETSPKWRAVSKNPIAEILIWYPSLQRQYRLTGRVETLDKNIVKQNWQFRPAESKYLDHAYTGYIAQSEVLDSREALIEYIETSKRSNPVEDLIAPSTAAGLSVVIERVECLDLNQPDRIHHRQAFVLEKGEWQMHLLMP